MLSPEPRQHIPESLLAHSQPSSHLMIALYCLFRFFFLD